MNVSKPYSVPNNLERRFCPNRRTTRPVKTRSSPGPQDPLEQLLFPPELIVHHQNTIGLSEEQKELFKGEISRARAEVSDLEWELRNAVETMTSLLRQDHVSEGAVLEQLDTVAQSRASN